MQVQPDDFFNSCALVRILISHLRPDTKLSSVFPQAEIYCCHLRLVKFTTEQVMPICQWFDHGWFTAFIVSVVFYGNSIL